jgi:hypothetical protein
MTMNDDTGALTMSSARNCSTETLRSAGDENNLTRQLSHERSVANERALRKRSVMQPR